MRTGTVPWFTADEAREYLGLPTMNSFYVFRHRSKLKAHRIGRRLRFRQVDLDAVVEADVPKRTSLRMVR